MEIKYMKSAARLLDRNFVNKRGLDLSKEVLLVSLGQRAEKLQDLRFGVLKKNSVAWPESNHTSAAWVRFPDDKNILQF